MIRKRSRFRLLPVESWSPVIQLLVRPYSLRFRWMSGIFMTTALSLIAYVDIVTGDRVNLKPFSGLLVLVAFVLFRFYGFLWLFAVVGIYQIVFTLHRQQPGPKMLVLDDIVVAVTFGVIGLLMKWLGEGLLMLKQVHQDIARDLKLAEEVQRQILSPPARLPWVVAEGMLRPTGEVGGDFYAIYPLNEQTLFFAIGDVQGKGVAAALTMTKVVALLSEMSRWDISLDRLLAKMNDRLVGTDNSMVTAFVGKVFYRGEGKAELKIAKAGHESGVLIFPDHSCIELNAPGLPLGIFPEDQYEERSWMLGRGDRVLLYTDGVADVRNDEVAFFGRERLESQAALLTRIQGNVEIHRWLVQLMDEVEIYRGSQEQEDDMALLGLIILP